MKHAAAFPPPQRDLFDPTKGRPAAPRRAPHATTEAALADLAKKARNRAIITACAEAMRDLSRRRARAFALAFAAPADAPDPTLGVTGDDATLWLRTNAPDVDPRILGAVFRNRGRDGGRWEFLEWRETKLEGRHVRPLRAWEWVDETGAR